MADDFERDIPKAYIGDGIYAHLTNGMLILTTEDGTRMTNEIYLEFKEWQALVDYVRPGLEYEEDDEE